MPHSARPGATGGDPGRRPTPTPASAAEGYRVRSAPYALARANPLCQPAQSRPASAFRALLAELTDLEAETAALLPVLGDALYASQGGHPQAFHRDTVLPLRRALHNGRDPRAELLGRLGDLPERLPQLARWLTLREQRALLLDELAASAEAALTAERAALSALCREPALLRAVALTSSDLLRALTRTGAGDAGSEGRARKEEPNVLRYALRAGTRTSPLSWFTAVGWGLLDTPATAAATDWGEADLPAAAPASVVRASRTLVGALCQALLDDPRRRAALPHRLASSARTVEGRACFSRSTVVFAGGRYLANREEEIGLPAGGPLASLASLGADPRPLRELAHRLSGTRDFGDRRPDGTAQVTEEAEDTDATGAVAAAAGYLQRLAGAGLLVPAEPVDPQDRDPLAKVAGWLRTAPEDTGLADRVDAIADRTRRFATAPADLRPALLTDLADRWTDLLARAGRPVPEHSAPLNVLSEDVVARRPLRLGGLLDRADHEALGEATALAELFDAGQVMRRIARDRFVDRYGAGGVCHHPWEFGPVVDAAWAEAGRLAALPPQDEREGELPSGYNELAAVRRLLIDRMRPAVPDSGTDHGADPGGADTDAVLPADLLQGLGERLPSWILARPSSYAFFLQRDSADGLLCVNHLYAGWGRFTSRFLDAMEPVATAEVARQIRHGLPEQARAAQIRPVGGFNANLHPLLVPDEIGPDRRWSSLAESELDLVHDRDSDQLRLRLRATGELLDVLYGGFLAPVRLPQRIAPLLADHPQGAVRLRSLVPRYTLAAPGGRVLRTPRLRHRHVVLRRRRWHLPAGVVQALRADLATGPALPVAATARWRTLLGLPEQLFLRPEPATPPARPAADPDGYLRRPKPQFVDLGNALHLQVLGRWLSRHSGGVVLEEALPAPGGRSHPFRAVELVLETYRAARPA
ncbi:lantibiotic dehydratase [Kitasatospora sp. NBC_01302]|uniref:lantibiotic dehydratase n=1 Tax=Kitasatospora sp. NBC_01302 TaxID=2903575 RepID=UPI002E13C9C0|nr:lantibiotic dehydratase family protein [Kitasatospora sp. NBC_01302]